MAKLAIIVLIVSAIVHSRSPAGISAFKSPYSLDILTNSIGGFMGFCAFICGSLKSSVTPRRL